MKLKARIIGRRVHEVGYRYFLMSNAIDLGLEGFSARNRMSGEAQEVIAMAEGDEGSIKEFMELIKAQKPANAEVSNIAFEEYSGNVMRAGEYAQVCTALQLNKAIPLLLDMRDDLKVVRKNTDSIPQIKANTDSIPQIKANTDSIPQIKANTDSIPQIKANTDSIPQIKANTDSIPQIKANTDAIPQVLEEIKGIKEDIQPGYAIQFRQVQADIRAIKERLGMR